MLLRSLRVPRWCVRNGSIRGTAAPLMRSARGLVSGGIVRAGEAMEHQSEVVTDPLHEFIELAFD